MFHLVYVCVCVGGGGGGGGRQCRVSGGTLPGILYAPRLILVQSFVSTVLINSKLWETLRI